MRRKVRRKERKTSIGKIYLGLREDFCQTRLWSLLILTTSYQIHRQASINSGKIIYYSERELLRESRSAQTRSWIKMWPKSSVCNRSFQPISRRTRLLNRSMGLHINFRWNLPAVQLFKTFQERVLDVRWWFKATLWKSLRECSCLSTASRKNASLQAISLARRRRNDLYGN